MGPRTISLTAGLVAALLAAVVSPAAPPSRGSEAIAPAAASAGHATPSGLPGDGPPALYRREPRLPQAHGWPASDDAFPRTSGTGRLDDGASYWTDYLYDDHGATAVSPGDISVTAGSPSFGTYVYPGGHGYHNNGADIFRAAVALRSGATYWRVDFTTLTDPDAPLAVWALDRDDDAGTGVSAWPGGANLGSPGIDTALMVTAGGARLVDLATGRVLHRMATTVTKGSGSFVVRVPRDWLRPTGTWRVRLAAGLAAPGGGFATPGGALPIQTAVYNVTFRSRSQETAKNNFWNDFAQVQALDARSAAPFSMALDWSRLARRARTAEPAPSGWNDRWYVSTVSLGPGMVASPDTITDQKANYLGRVQPYAVYVPHGYRPSRPVPLTFLLHSLTQNHNQYAATTPHLTQGACEARHSICVTTLGRGPDGGYFGEAELDFWQVWHQVAHDYALDPDRTVISGYSMGGIGSNQLAMAHPDLFARSIALAGGVGNVPALGNLRYVPTYLAGGAADELVLVTVQRAQAEGMRARGERVRWIVVPAMDHVAYELCDCFDDAIAYMGDAARRAERPRTFDFRWTPRSVAALDDELSGGAISWTQRPDLGVGTTGAYWVRDLHARSKRVDAQVHADSRILPGRRVSTRTTDTIDPTIRPEPSLLTELRWVRGKANPPHALVVLRLQNVASLRLLTGLAGYPAGKRGRLDVTTDGATVLHIGDRVVHLHAGRHVLRFRG